MCLEEAQCRDLEQDNRGHLSVNSAEESTLIEPNNFGLTVTQPKDIF